MGSYGMGCYSINLILNPNEIYYLKLNNIYTAYKVYLNDQPISQLGQVGEVKDRHKPAALVTIRVGLEKI